jgi:hypothetical protein
VWDGDDRRHEPRRVADRELVEYRLDKVEKLAELNAHALDAIETIIAEFPTVYLPRRDTEASGRTKRETVALYFAGLSSFCSFCGTLVLVVTKVH